MITPTNPDGFFSPRTPLQAADAVITTSRDTYFASGVSFGSPHTRTVKFSVIATRLSDGATAPSIDNLIVKRSGYASAAGIGHWTSYKEAVRALLELGVQHFEPETVALSNPVTGSAFVRLEAVGHHDLGVAL